MAGVRVGVPPPSQADLAGLLNRKHIYTSCREITRVLNESWQANDDFREFYKFLPQLMVSLFRHRGWLDETSRPEVNPVDYDRNWDAITALLSPNGPLWRVLLAYADEPSFVYEFPTERLPAPTRQLLVSGDYAALPEVYQAKIPLFPRDRPWPDALTLNTVEYYLFCLAHFAVDERPTMPAARTASSPSYYAPLTSLSGAAPGLGGGSVPRSSKKKPPLYLTIVKDLLCTLFPLPQSAASSSSSSSGSGRALSPRASTSASPASKLAAVLPSPFVQRTPSGSKKSSSTEAGAAAVPTSQRLEVPLALANHALMILLEFWTGQNTAAEAVMAHVVPPYLTPTWTTLDCLNALVSHLCKAYATPNCFASMPMYLMRGGASPAQHAGTPPRPPSMPMLLQQSPPSPLFLLQQPLYRFIRLALNRWPRGHSGLAEVVRMWLAFVQPWDRELSTSSSKKTPSKSGSSSKKKNTSQGVEVVRVNLSVEQFRQRWAGYMLGNFLFYTTLLRDFIAIAGSFDLLGSESDLHLTDKVVCAFNMHPIMEILAAGEHQLLNPMAPAIGVAGTNTQTLAMHCSYLEGAGSEYFPLSHPTTLRLVRQLINALQNAHAQIKRHGRALSRGAAGSSSSTSTPGRSGGESSAARRLSSWLADATPGNVLPTASTTQREKRLRTIAQLVVDLREMFGVLDDDAAAAAASGVATDLHGIGAFAQRVPGALWASSRGALGRSAARDIQYRGDGALRPIASYESAMLVRFFLMVSRAVYKRTGVMLDLRPAASYYNLVRVAVLLVFARLALRLLVGL